MRISDWSSDVCSSDLPARLEVAARARLPVEASESAEIVAFRSPEEASDHVALIIGRRDANPPVVSLHSECLTGDVLGSLKCDRSEERQGGHEWVRTCRSRDPQYPYKKKNTNDPYRLH